MQLCLQSFVDLLNWLRKEEITNPPAGQGKLEERQNMNKQEFADWKAHTEASKAHWQLDEIQLHNHNRYLFYIGGCENGRFITIEADGETAIGNYSGALPCITDALFIEKHTRKFDTQEIALTKIMECLGTKFLLDFMGMRAYETRIAV